MAELRHVKQQVCLVILCGLPGAGKTTLAGRLLKSHNPHQHLAPNLTGSAPCTKTHCMLVLPFDAIIPQGLNLDRGIISSEEQCEDGSLQRSTVWKEYRQAIHDNINTLLNSLHSCQNSTNQPRRPIREIVMRALSLDSEHESEVAYKVRTKFLEIVLNQSPDLEYDDELATESKAGVCDNEYFLLVLDDNMFYRSMRYEYYQLARKYGTSFAQVYLHCPVSVALTRNQARQCSVADDTIITMASKFEPPDLCKASWEQFTVTLNTENDWNEDAIKIWCVVKQALAKPAPPYQELDLDGQERSRAVSRANVLHQMDGLLRKSVAEVMKESISQNKLGKAELLQLANRVNRARISILDEVRNKRITPPPLATEHTPDSNTNTGFQEFVRALFIERTTNNLI